MPKISVIIPVYNMEEYLAECLDSVQSQTISEDIEVVCVNDGSTDASLSILREYSEKYDNIVVIDQENTGVGIARNHGILAAAGEYVAFMDPDDYYPKTDVLEKLYLTAKAQDVKICGGSVAQDLGDRIKIAFVAGPNTNVFYEERLINYWDYQWDYFYQRFIYDRAMLLDHKVFFPPYIRFQDPPFFVRAMITAEKFYAIKDVTYVHRTGHKKINWTPERVRGLLNGLIDDLVLSRDHELKSLHAMTVHRILWENGNAILRNASDPVVLELLYKADRIIRTDWIEDPSEKYGVLSFLRKAANDIRTLNGKLDRANGEKRKSDETEKKLVADTERKAAEIQKLKGSVSFRLGRVMTAPGRKVRDVFRGLKKEG